MSIDIAKLKAAALAATPGKWWIDSHGSAMVSFTVNGMKTIFVTNGEAMGKAVRHQDTGNLSHWRNDNDATFIAAANPAAVLELIAQNEAMVAAHVNLKLLADTYRQAYEEARARIAELEARTVSVKIKPPTIGRAYSALAHVWTVQEVREACTAAGINLETGGE